MSGDFYPSSTRLESPGHNLASGQPREFVKSRFQLSYKQQK